ncbi:TVP38/TMEM64 family protein [Nitrospinota bacterium]
MTNFFSPGRAAPLIILVAGMIAFFALGLDRYLSFEVLRENRHLLLRWVESYGLAAALAYMAIYAAAVAFSVPGGAVMSITGGFLFGAVWGSLYILVGATAGATLLFIVAKTSVGDYLRGRAGPWMKKMEEGFGENALSYLLVLRLVPLFPFFVVNLVPAFLGVPLSTYVLATFVGIIPGVIVYASVGAGLGSIFDAGGEFNLSGILTPQITAALIGLAVLALIPVVYKKIKAS